MSAKPKRKPGQCQCKDTGCPCRGNCSVRRVKLVKNSLDGDWLACAVCRQYRGIEPKRKPRKVRRVVLLPITGREAIFLWWRLTDILDGWDLRPGTRGLVRRILERLEKNWQRLDPPKAKR